MSKPEAVIAVGETAMSSPFVCSWTKAGRHTAWVRVTGQLDPMTRPGLERGLDEAQAEAEARLLVLDLRELTYIDTAGVDAILASSLRARRAGRRLILVRGSEQIDRIFTLTGAAGELEIHDLDPAGH